MIKVSNLNKYFFRHKKNEIHVINNVSLDLPEKGLIALFGPSGGGKTTLLNVIGGLDKAKGSIMYNDQNYSNYNMSKWDQMRTHDIGYIFQNYLLVGELSVYENIKMTLEMIGIKDKELIDNRIDYLLESVGLKNYKRRRASQLSGGQQQRIAIARALAKNPKVIIADEPTGNLDSRNTVEIMNIIKKISEDKLVLLVTHEANIANTYADRIIKIEDGKITSDVLNDKQNAQDFIHHSDIYLEDLEKTTLNEADVKIELYGDFKASKMKLVNKDGTIYIDFGTDKKVVIIDSESETKLIDHKQEEMTQDVETTFEYDKYFEKPTHKSKFSFISLKRSILLAFNQVLNASRRRRVLLVGFVLSGILIAFMSSWMLMVFDSRNNQFRYPKEELQLFVQDSASTIMKDDEAFVHDQSLSLEYQGVLFDQVTFRPNVSFYIIPSHINKATIIHGRDVSNTNAKEITLDRKIAQDYLDSGNSYLKTLGYSVSSLVDHSVKIYGETFKIVGITDFNYGYTRMNYDVYRIIYAKNMIATLGEENTDEQLINLFNTTTVNRFGKLYSKTPKETKERLEAQNIKVENDYEKDYKEYLSAKQSVFNSIMIMMFVISGLIWLSLYFIIRSNLFSRIDEIKVYRALGVKRIDIIKIFLVEVIVLTTLTSLLGFLGTMYFIINNNLLTNFSMVLYTPLQMILAVLFMYTFNIIFGTLPVISLLRKTPAAIIAQAEA